MSDKKMKIGVLLGGTSAEREVSLKSGVAVSKALVTLGYDVLDIDVDRNVARAILDSEIDLAFIALHGGTGEDGSIQGMLEVMGIPYTGSGVMASAIAMDKVISKHIFKSAGLSVPEFEVLTQENDDTSFELPVVVKPSKEGSSIGVSIVRTEEEFRVALKNALAYEGPALIERYIKGKEVQIAVLGDRALGGVEVRPTNEFYDFEAKYTAGKTEYILPPEIDDDTYGMSMDCGLAAHNALGCSGATRVDLLIDEVGGEIFVLEVNTIPGMTETSLLPKIAQMAGFDFPALIESIVRETVR
ncbi:D-alanine--D-alanine ligase [Nitrospirota bacterium]